MKESRLSKYYPILIEFIALNKKAIHSFYGVPTQRLGPWGGCGAGGGSSYLTGPSWLVLPGVACRTTSWDSLPVHPPPMDKRTDKLNSLPSLVLRRRKTTFKGNNVTIILIMASSWTSSFWLRLTVDRHFTWASYYQIVPLLVSSSCEHASDGALSCCAVTWCW